jgi:hypothetical protein
MAASPFVVRVRTRLTVATLLSVIAAVGSFTSTRALPLFSRATDVACASCHIGATRLTPAGLAFELRGDRLLSAHGDSLLRSQVLPLSLVAEAGSAKTWRVISPARVTPIGREAATFEIHARKQWGDVASLALASRLQDDERPQTSLAYVEIGESTRPAAWSVDVGKFDAELPFFSPRLRPTNAANLAPLGEDATGVALGARDGKWATGAGLVDGERHPQGDHAERVIRGLQDTYWWIARQQANTLFGARMLFDHQDSTLPSLRWMQHLKVEAGASLTAGPLTLIPGYVLERFDDRPAAGMHERHQYALLEALRALDPRQQWVASARYEYAYRTANAGAHEANGQQAVANVAYSPVPEARVALEGSLARDTRGSAVRSLDLFVRMSY